MKIAALILVILGVLSIVFSKQLGSLYEGGQYTMSDLGFVVYGMLFIGVGLLSFLVIVALQWKKR